MFFRLKRKIDDFLSLKLSSTTANDIQLYLDDIFNDPEFIFWQNTLHVGYYMIRVRADFEYKYFFNILDIAYKPPHLNTKYQRASIPYDTMLYCCSCERRELLTYNPYTDIVYGLKVALYETIDDLRDNILYKHNPNKMFFDPMDLRINKNFNKKVTYSIWVVTKDMNLVRLVPFKYHDFQIYDQRMALNFFNNRSYGDYDIQAIIELYNFLGNEFLNLPNDNDKFKYLFSAHATNSICKLDNYFGVSYPSVRCDGAGINLAIKPTAIVKDYLRCIEIGTFDLICKNNQLFFENILTHFNLEPGNSPSSLLELSISNNKKGIKEMILREYPPFRIYKN